MGARKWHEGTKQPIRQLKKAALQNNGLIGIATLVPQTNLPETPYTKGETLKAKSDGFQEDHSYGTPFSAWEPPMEVY